MLGVQMPRPWHCFSFHVLRGINTFYCQYMLLTCIVDRIRTIPLIQLVIEGFNCHAWGRAQSLRQCSESWWLYIHRVWSECSLFLELLFFGVFRVLQMFWKCHQSKEIIFLLRYWCPDFSQLHLSLKLGAFENNEVKF